MAEFGAYIRGKREERRATDPTFTLEAFARRIGMAPSYLSNIERGKAPPSKGALEDIARGLGEDLDVLYLLAGLVSDSLQAVIRDHPTEFAALIRSFKGSTGEEILDVAKKVRDGAW